MKNWRIWLSLVISAAFLYWAARQAGDLTGVVLHLSNADYRWIGPALVAYFAGVWLRAVRWKVLLAPIKRVSVSRLFVVVAIGYMANNVLPARLGEVVRAYVLKEREGVSRFSSLATIAVERMFDGIAMLIFIGVASLLMPFNEEVSNIFRLAGVIFIGALIILLIIVSSQDRTRQLARLVLARLPTRISARAGGLLEKVLAGLTALQRPGSLMAILALSLLAWLLEASMYYLIGIGFNLNIPLVGYLLTTAVINLGTMVPSSPGYVGTFEALGVLALGFLGADKQLAFAYIVALHLALLVPITVLGFVYMWRHNLSLATASSADPAISEERSTDG